MSANPADEALERLNYFNGQRLAATDFRAEQGYHLGMRRVLNHALYSPGIVAGLQVGPDLANKHRVIVSHGLAFDHLGREIFVPQDVFVQAMGAPSTKPGVVFGNLLVVSYREQRKHPVSDGCAVAAPCTPCSGDLAWGAPTRIAADVVFEFLDSWPADDSGRIVLAQIELSKTCEVKRVLPGVRKYAMPVKPQTVLPVSLEGEKDLDAANPKVLHFHVTGGAPEAVTLYLRARKFSSLYYTEMGKHTHTSQIAVDLKKIDLKHNHNAQAAETDDDEPTHKHDLLVQDDEGTGLEAVTGEPTSWRSDEIGGGKHRHKISQLKIDDRDMNADHTHTASASVGIAGVTNISARTGNKVALTYVKGMEVWLDGKDLTNEIRAQLAAKPGQAGNWAQLGDGTSGHEIATPEGTGEIDLLKLGVEIGLGSHKLEFRVAGADVGGCIQYNLYVG